MQLERLAPRKPQDSGTPRKGFGVPPVGGFSIRIRVAHPAPGQSDGTVWAVRSDGLETVCTVEPARRRGVRRTMLLLLLALSLVGQGEKFYVDPRFRTPSATLNTYWEALSRQDLSTVNDCYADPGSLQPFPGMLWFLPPVDEIDLTSMRLVGAEAGHLIAMYEVQFRPTGIPDVHSFVTTTELRRVGWEWHVIPNDEAGLPAWQPYPRAVDI